MFKYPIYKQDNNYSCGAYCIKMILKYYHLDIEIKEIKEKCNKCSERGEECKKRGEICPYEVQNSSGK